MNYDFNEIIDRRNTQSSKWDNVGPRVGNPDALPMWVADSDFRCPKPVVDAVVKRAEHAVFGYPYVVPEFRSVTADWVQRRHGWKINPDWVIFSTGIVPVLNTMVQAFTQPGDEVIVQQPVYYPFMHAIEDNGRQVSPNSLIYRDGAYTVDFDDLEKRAENPKAKIMILCNPHNPVCRVYTRDELKKMADICLKNHVIMISDEIHSDLIYSGHKHTPVASIGKEYEQNTVTCYAPSKTFNIAGLRASGVVVPNDKIRKGLQEQFGRNRSIQQNVFAVPAYIAAYTQCEDYLEQEVRYLEENVKYLDGFLKENMPKIRLVKPQGTFLMWLDCTELGLKKDRLAEFFIQKAQVAIDRGDWFGNGGDGFARLNIACPRATLKLGLEKILSQYRKL